MSTVNFVGDIVESNGKTWKENNLAKQHDIPLGTLVEITYKSDYEDEEDSKYGLRLFVVNHSRDCDGTPLYDMSFDKNSYKEFKLTEDKIKNNDFENKMDEALVKWMHQRVSGSILRHYGRESIKAVEPCK